ncbi:MAG: cysteine hydrolase [Sandaracinaceae bacterium]|nr:cysteine hydrolase [Sandaracinaceae bacterium]
MSPLDPRRTVFVDIDTQVDFVEPTGALYVPAAETLKNNLAMLIRSAGARGVPIVASADAHGQDDPEFAIFPPHCVAGTPGQKRIAETEPERARVIALGAPAPAALEPGVTVVIEKVKFDLFTNPAAGAVIRASGATTAVVFGVALDYCVRAAALGLRDRGYETIVARDATAPVTAEGGAKAEVELRNAGVRFASTAEVVAALG